MLIFFAIVYEIYGGWPSTLLLGEDATPLVAAHLVAYLHWHVNNSQGTTELER